MMKPKHARKRNRPKRARSRRPANQSAKIEADEIERITNAIAELLVKTGSYEPAVDNITINQIVQSQITYNKLAPFLNSTKPNEYTYSRVIDAQVKLVKIINDGFQQLGLLRHDRLEKRFHNSNSDISQVNTTQIEKKVQELSEDEQTVLSKLIMRHESQAKPR